MKDFILNKYNTLKYLFGALLLCFFLLVFRIKTTHDFFGLFLVWNLFLAFVPLGVAWYMQHRGTQLNSISKYTLLVLWLLFLPNAPYVITDVIHLSYSPSNWFIYDGITIGVFALLSLYFGFQSSVTCCCYVSVNNIIYRCINEWLRPTKADSIRTAP